MKKLALITGINYRNTRYELGGCINDASDILHKLVKEFDFNQTDIQLLIEEEATRKNILDGLDRLVKELEPGDIGVFTYSGHGTQTADLPPIGEDDMLDEAIVPIDTITDRSNLIRDDEIQERLSNLAKNVHFVVIFDSCHSATGTKPFDLQPDSKDNTFFFETTDKDNTFFFKTPEEENTKLYKRSLPPTQTISDMQSIMSDLVISTKGDAEHPLSGENHILLSGCKANELSFDDGNNGYFTKALIKNMVKGITYQELYDKARQEVFNRSKEKQEPQIEAPSPLNTMKIFE